eukprot:TRINITY_DN81460_c0_g1_i1.p1 TRINITY_DN81460_c0_g1~~TRINITY_DN81460_c0_g1_i1.p1  ORF type:complete len:777 (+),score=115.24 TRINITY_DN81460_c0_g1_i1:120-2450(+)
MARHMDADEAALPRRKSILKRQSIFNRLSSGWRRAAGRAPVVSFEGDGSVWKDEALVNTHERDAQDPRGAPLRGMQQREASCAPNAVESPSWIGAYASSPIEDGYFSSTSSSFGALSHSPASGCYDLRQLCVGCATPRSTTTGSTISTPRGAWDTRLGQKGPCPGLPTTPDGPEVFLLYASPLSYSALDIRSEAEMLSQVFTGTNVRFNISVATANSLTNVLALARARGGLVLHLSVHTVNHPEKGLGLVLEDSCGGPHILWRDALEDLLSVGGEYSNLSLLFLSTCYSDELAQVFVECGCRHVIATRERVHDSAARRFAQQFYHELVVRAPLLTAWEGARQALRIDPDETISAHADHMLLYGQREADTATLDKLCALDRCGTPQRSHITGAPMRDFEDVSSFLDSGLPTRPENFMGRTRTLHAIASSFRGSSARRVCVVHGPPGVGKSALGVEFAHFAAAPGRLFSCSTVVLPIKVTDVDDIAGQLEEQVEGLASQLGVLLRPTTGSSMRSGLSRSSTLASNTSDTSVMTYDGASSSVTAAEDGLSFHVLAQARICRVLQQLERTRRLCKILFIIDDDIGCVRACSQMRSMLGEIIEHTHHVHFLILSREPIYDSLGATKIVNEQLRGLAHADAARLLLKRIHRRLEPRDGIGDLLGLQPGAATRGGSQTSSKAAAAASLVERTVVELSNHPLMARLEGHPGRIVAVSSKVVPGGPSLLELASQDGLLGPSAVEEMPRQLPGATAGPLQLPAADVDVASRSAPTTSYRSDWVDLR